MGFSWVSNEKGGANGQRDPVARRRRRSLREKSRGDACENDVAKDEKYANNFHRCSSLVYIEGEATMRKFTNADNQEQQALSIVQRMHWPL